MYRLRRDNRQYKALNMAKLPLTESAAAAAVHCTRTPVNALKGIARGRLMGRATGDSSARKMSKIVRALLPSGLLLQLRQRRMVLSAPHSTKPRGKARSTRTGGGPAGDRGGGEQRSSPGKTPEKQNGGLLGCYLASGGFYCSCGFYCSYRLRNPFRC